MTASFSTLIDPSALAAGLGEPDWVVFDCRLKLSDPEYGRRSYGEGHLPGARFADMLDDLSGPLSAASGRHPLPDWDTFRAWLGANGVGHGSQVVAYDDADGMAASRLWYMLRVLGHKRVAVLNGGLTQWREAGHPLDSITPSISPAVFQGAVNAALLADLAEVERTHGQPGTLLVDARGAARFRGETEPLDPRAGHIPGARNLPSGGNVNEDGTFKTPAELRGRLLDVIGDAAPETVVHYCGSGVSACHNLLAQLHAGLPLGRLYAGSWSQWCADPTRPGATGEA